MRISDWSSDVCSSDLAGVVLAAFFGAILGAPTLKLRGDYLAIVTLGFGEIVRIFMNNLDAPVNITNGPQGINRIDTFSIGEFAFGRSQSLFGFRIKIGRASCRERVCLYL